MIGWRPSSCVCYDIVKSATLGQIVALAVMAYLGFDLGVMAPLYAIIGVHLSLYIMLFDKQRWKDVCPVTKLVRYCVFRPRRLVQFCWWIVKWAVYGLKPLEYEAVVEDEFPETKFSRLETLRHFWTICRSMSDYDMQHWYTIDELKEQLTARCESKP